jgi:hypothetical protein
MPDLNAGAVSDIEPLEVADADMHFHVTKSIDQCPPGLQARELLANAVEAEMLPEENGVRSIQLYAVNVDEVPKLAIRNTGRGMTADELKRATDLSSSIRKTQGLDWMQNRGEGAKVASLPWNHAGLRIRSCHSGRVSEVLLQRKNNTYGRARFQLFDEASYDTVWDITEDAQQEGQATDHDWTEVVCLGCNSDQDTTRWPYGKNRGEGTRREVLTEIFDRYYAVPPRVKLEAHESLHGRKRSSAFRLMNDVIARWGDDHTKLRSERVAIRDKITIEFVHTPMLSGGNTVMGAHELTGQSSRIAFVWNGEMYDACIGAEWRRIAAGFGLPHVHSEVSVFIHIPDDGPVRNGPYRLDLRSKDTGEALEVEDFNAEVRLAMPAWVRQLVEKALQPRRASDMTAVKKELEKRLREARIRPVDLNRPGESMPITALPGSDVQTDLGADASDEDTTQLSAKKRATPSPTVADPDAPFDQKPNPQPKKQSASPIKRRRSTQTVTTAPEIIWLDEPDKVAAEDLHDRAGKYDTATNTLYLNGLYEAVDGKITKLEKLYSQQVDWDSVRGLVTDKVRAEMALHIGSVVVYALAKQGRPAWPDSEWKSALSKPSLTVAADQSDYLLSDIRSALGATSAFKAAKVV